MLYFVRGTDLFLYPKLAQTMFHDRKKQFFDRLGWPVSIDQFGNERDQYDACNPYYVIVADETNHHLASLRLLPSTGPTMINDFFLDALGGRTIHDERVWECTRLCIRAGAPDTAVPQLLAATGFLMAQLGIDSLIGVFSHVMLRQYARLGANPIILGSSQHGGEVAFAGRWRFAPQLLSELTRRSGLMQGELELSLVNSPIFRKDDRTGTN